MKLLAEIILKINLQFLETIMVLEILQKNQDLIIIGTKTTLMVTPKFCRIPEQGYFSIEIG